MSEYTLQEIKAYFIKRGWWVSDYANSVEAAIAREAELRAENERLRDRVKEVENADAVLFVDLCNAQDDAKKAEQRIAELEAAGAQGMSSEWRECLSEFVALKGWLAGDDFDMPEPEIRKRLDLAASKSSLLLQAAASGTVAENAVAERKEGK